MLFSITLFYTPQAEAQNSDIIHRGTISPREVSNPQAHRRNLSGAQVFLELREMPTLQTGANYSTTTSHFNKLGGANHNYILDNEALSSKTYRYHLRPILQDGDRIGVTTIDQVLVRGEILQIWTLNSFQLIAADMNHTGSVTTRDIAEMRRLSQRVIDNISPGDSWEFIHEKWIINEEGEDFISDRLPFDAKLSSAEHEYESNNYSPGSYIARGNGNILLNASFPNDITIDAEDASFTAIKRGDINNSHDSLIEESNNWSYDDPAFYIVDTAADYNTFVHDQGLSIGSIDVSAPSVSISKDSIYLFDFKVDSNYNCAAAMQLALTLPGTLFEIQSASNGDFTDFLKVEENEDPIRIHESDTVYFQWLTADTNLCEDLSTNDLIFSIQAKALTSFSFSSNNMTLLTNSDEIVRKDTISQDLKVSLDITKIPSPPGIIQDLDVVHNEVLFNSSESGKLSLRVFGLNGQLIEEMSLTAFKGQNSIQLQSPYLPGNLYFINFQFKDKAANTLRWIAK